MADTAITQILVAFKALLDGYAPLAGKTVIIDRSPDDALDEAELPAIVIYAHAWRFDPGYDQGQTTHYALIHFDSIETSMNVGVVNRANQEALADIVAAIHSDRTLGGRVEDIQEIDVAPPMDNGRSVSGASLATAITFYTPRGDHRTIVT